RPGSLLEELCQWSQGKVADEVFSRRVFEHWNNELSLSAKAVTERVPEDAAIFLRAVNELAFAKLETETVAEKIEWGIGRLFDINKLAVNELAFAKLETETVAEKIGRGIGCLPDKVINLIPSLIVRLKNPGYAGNGDDDDGNENGSVTLPRMINVCGHREGNNVNLLEASETIPDEIEKLLRQETGEVPKKLIPVMNSRKKLFYQVLAESSDDKWVFCFDKPKKTRAARIEVAETVYDRFVLLLDPGIKGLKHSSEVMMSVLNSVKAEDRQISPYTVIIDLEIRDSEGGSK
ncbi:MAG: hypothetical protein DRI57_06145, partial [Deltaproteobacteria bacterium]